MILDYSPRKRLFSLRVPRGEEDIVSLVREHGLDFSTSASTAAEAILLTAEPYVAASFSKRATRAAFDELLPMLQEIEDSRRPSSGSHFRVPDGHDLWPFQKADLDYMLRRKHSIDADEPGLGKTPTAIVYANEIGAKSVLVVCPASIRLQWCKRIGEWSTMARDYRGYLDIHCVVSSRRGVSPTSPWTVISYEMARSQPILNALVKRCYDLLIVDEAHYLKERGAKRTQAVLGALFKQAEHAVFLTGTPLPNRPVEAFPIVSTICPDAIDFMGQEDFAEYYNPSVPISGRPGFHREEGHTYELQNRLRANVMTRHSKREVMPQLKMPVFDLVYGEETGAVKRALDAERLLDIDPTNLSGASASVLGAVATVRKEMGIALAPQVAAYARERLAGGEAKIVIFAWHIAVLDILEQALHNKGCLRIDGSTSSNRKAANVARFIRDPGCHFLIGNMLSMGVGVDGLQDVCAYGLIAEPDWVLGNNVQAFDRLDRGGQSRTVYGEIFLARGSFAEKILAVALGKGQAVHQSLDAKVGE